MWLDEGTNVDYDTNDEEESLGFDADKLRDALSIPTNVNLWSVIAIGYPAALDTFSAEALERELKARQRRPLNEHFFEKIPIFSQQDTQFFQFLNLFL